MTLDDDGITSPRPPVVLGCGLMITAVVALFVVGACLTIYLDSGANTGEMVLEDARAYAFGSYEYVGARNYFIVRLPDGAFLALADLDAANRATPERRCRVQAVPAGDPAHAALLELHGRRISTFTGGWTLMFRESCNGAVYDAAGIRLDRDGRNLDRFPVSVNPERRLVVDVSARECSLRQAASYLRSTSCAE